ncbi:hypothetical protein BJ508DRAFT_350260 [Ascobolus immersus RN42]|uniref:Uncharacterized protein n=1 Tax=Ascobolus immersus RN42 TaxID=1160509 RepID=A0A3N4IJP6_ASCIM|nr:hypothetical protein BJ508DRAFT_350260 [Ascobolus immersus RN42]
MKISTQTLAVFAALAASVNAATLTVTETLTKRYTATRVIFESFTETSTVYQQQPFTSTVFATRTVNQPVYTTIYQPVYTTIYQPGVPVTHTTTRIRVRPTTITATSVIHHAPVTVTSTQYQWQQGHGGYITVTTTLHHYEPVYQPLPGYQQYVTTTKTKWNTRTEYIRGHPQTVTVHDYIAMETRTATRTATKTRTETVTTPGPVKTATVTVIRGIRGKKPAGKGLTPVSEAEGPKKTHNKVPLNVFRILGAAVVAPADA